MSVFLRKEKGGGWGGGGEGGGEHVRKSWAVNHPILFNEPDLKLFEKPFKNPPSKCSPKCSLKLSVSIYGDIWVYEIYGYDDIRKNVLSPQNERLVKRLCKFSLKCPP